jgi:sulfate transport system ATP-binding protein
MHKGRIEQDGAPGEVIEHPASPFVMNFVGSVNRFPGEISDGRGTFGAFSMDYAQPAGTGPRKASAYARPYELSVSRTDAGGGVWADVQHITPAGALFRAELRTDDAGVINVDVPRSDRESLALVPGARVYVKPQRLQVFFDE